MPPVLLALLGSKAFWLALLVSGAGLWVLDNGIDIGRSREQAAQRRQIDAANKRIRLADQRWVLKYQHDSAARAKTLEDALAGLAKSPPGALDIPADLLAQINRIKP